MSIAQFDLLRVQRQQEEVDEQLARALHVADEQAQADIRIENMAEDVDEEEGKNNGAPAPPVSQSTFH